MTCPLTKTTHDLPNGGMIWFDEVDDFISEVCTLLMGFVLLTHRVRIYCLTPVAQPNPLNQQMFLIAHQVCVKLVTIVVNIEECLFLYFVHRISYSLLSAQIAPC